MPNITAEIEKRLEDVCTTYIKGFQIKPETKSFEQFRSRLGTSMFTKNKSGKPIIEICGPAKAVETDMDDSYSWYSDITWEEDNLIARYSFPLTLSWPEYFSPDEVLCATTRGSNLYHFNLQEAEVRFATRHLSRDPGSRSDLVFDAQKHLFARSKSVLLSIFPKQVKQEVDLSKLFTHDLVHRT